MNDLKYMSLEELENLRLEWVKSHTQLSTRIAYVMVVGLNAQHVTTPGFTNRVFFEDNITDSSGRQIVLLKTVQGNSVPYQNEGKQDFVTTWCITATVITQEGAVQACSMHVHFNSKLAPDYTIIESDYFIPGAWVVLLEERVRMAESVIEAAKAGFEQGKRKKLLDLLSLSDKL